MPGSPYKLKMTLDVVASMLKKVYIEQNLDETVEDDDDEEEEYSGNLKSPREVEQDTNLELILKQNSDEWDPIRDADKFEQKKKAIEEMK